MNGTTSLITILAMSALVEADMVGMCFRIDTKNDQGKTDHVDVKVIDENEDDILIFIFEGSSTLQLNKLQVSMSIMESKWVGIKCPEGK